MAITVQIVHPRDVEPDDLERLAIAPDALEGLRELAGDDGVMPLPAGGEQSATHFVFYRVTDDGETGELCRTRYKCREGEAPDLELLGRSMLRIAEAHGTQKARAAKRDAERAKLDAEEAAKIAADAAAKAEAAEAAIATTDEGGDSE